MSNRQLFFTLVVLFSLILLCCTKTPDKYKNEIVAGSSKITGTINLPEKSNRDSIVLTISLLRPITLELVTYDILVDSLGKFSFDFDVEIDTTYIGLRSSLNPDKMLRIRAVNGEVTHVDITYDANKNIKFIEITPVMNKYDAMQNMDILIRMANYRPIDPNWEYPKFYDKSIDDFLAFANSNVSKRIDLFVNKDNLISNEFKDLIAKDYRLFLYTAHVFNYESTIKRNYRNATQDTINIPKIQKIDRSYFIFLKDFDLNDLQYLNTFTFPEFQDSILQNNVLGIPMIGDSDIHKWLTYLKSVLSDLVGFDDGQYYDVLAANAYARQMNIQGRPLSEKQKENIKDYWGNGEIAKILFRKNEKVLTYSNLKSPTVVHDVSAVPKEVLMNEIVAKYKNKGVFIDLWATWCAPCLEAMKQFKNVKGDFKDKDVVFVYITNGSSPKKLWEQNIQGIGSEHYYLTDEQWEYMMDQMGFEGIPSYVLYNKEGSLVNKFTSFPGNEKVVKMINNVL